jgi:hypothetical protein
MSSPVPLKRKLGKYFSIASAISHFPTVLKGIDAELSELLARRVESPHEKPSDGRERLGGDGNRGSVFKIANEQR